jgi:dTDP-4-dehydrorhamnose reductase
VISWFDFATAIALEGRKNCKVLPIPSSAYPTPAKRPGYSVMDCSRLVNDYGIELNNWELSLRNCISKLLSN